MSTTRRYGKKNSNASVFYYKFSNVINIDDMIYVKICLPLGF